ncbi:hypothetical protein HWV62_1344 [Athelia sp. TMB]|nr:hypothetical protein HWV62_1344 [Athelia sp. TMB]
MFNSALTPHRTSQQPNEMGGFLDLVLQSFPPSSKFKVEDVPDLTGKVALVTGANTGVGLEIAKEKCEAAIQTLRTATGKDAVSIKLDLASLSSVAAAAKEFLRGVLAPPIDELTENGYDLTFGTNVLGHYYLTTLLLPALTAAAASDPSFRARVVSTSSVGHHFHGIDYAALKDGPERRKMGGQYLYSQSKYKMMLYEPSYGALTPLWAGTTDAGKDLNGKYLIPWARVGSARPDSQDPEVGQKLWAWLEEQVREFEGR